MDTDILDELSIDWSDIQNNPFDSSSPSSFASSSHTHGNVTNDGKIGSTANKPLITTTGGAITTGSFGTSANSFCEGNDSRLSDSRTPTSHASSSTTYGVGTSSNYGHNKVINSLYQTTYTDGESLSAYQGYVLNNKISNVYDTFHIYYVSTLPDYQHWDVYGVYFLKNNDTFEIYVHRPSSSGTLGSYGSLVKIATIDDAHTHSISDVTNLQTSLNGKVDVGDAVTSISLVPKGNDPTADAYNGVIRLYYGDEPSS